MAILRYFHRKRTVRAGDKFAKHVNAFTLAVVLSGVLGQTDYWSIVLGEHIYESVKIHT